MPLHLMLVDYRRPLEAPQKLSPTEKKQLTALLEQEGTTIAAAARDPEMSMELVDVVDGNGKVKYLLYLWPFGSGALFKAGTTTVVANVTQHGFAMVEDDAPLREAIAAAWKASAKKLKIEETIEFSVPARMEGKDIKLSLRAAYDEHFHRNWCPYPKRRPADLTSEQRVLLDQMLALEMQLSQYDGLFMRAADNLRFLGKTPPGPSDVLVTIGNDTVPLWCAVSDVGSGHATHDVVLGAFLKLPPGKALAAWTEIASRKAYDVLESHRLAEKFSKKLQRAVYAHSTRVFTWLADGCVALGEPGRGAAMEILDELPDVYFSGQLHACALALVRHTKVHGTEFPSRFDPLVERLRAGPNQLTEFSEAVRDEIFELRGLTA